MSKAGPSLKEIQQLMQEAVTSPEGTSAIAEMHIEAHGRGPTPTERMEVYSYAWFARLEEGLRQDYPVLAENLGDEAWTGLIQDYLRAHPPSGHDLATVGDAIPEYMIERDSSSVLGPLPELACLERAIYQVRGAADSAVWLIEELQHLSLEAAESLRFELSPGTTLHLFNWNVDAIEWRRAPPVKGLRPVVVYRQDFAPSYESVGEDEYRFLTALIEKPLLTDLIQQFETTPWMTWLAKFTARGVLRRYNG